MNKAIFVVLALFAIVSAEQFKTINFNQGKLHFRSLDTTSSLKSYPFLNYTGNAAVNVDFGGAYLQKAGIDTTQTQTDMIIALYSSATIFVRSSSKFVDSCSTTGVCEEDRNTPLQTVSPNFWVKTGYPFTIPVTIGSDSSSWRLNSKALIATSYDTNYVSYTGQYSYDYVQNRTTYGLLGMGIDGDSAANFKGDHPLFSIVVNSSASGSGQLIFGKDSTQYDISRTPQVMKTNANWTMAAKNMSIGPNMTTFSQNVDLILDVQYPGLGIPSNQFDDIFKNKMNKLYKLNNTVSETFGDKNSTYHYKGNLADLPNIIFGLSNGQNLTIPPQAYTKKLEDNVYALLINPVSSVYSYGFLKDTNYYYFAILGWPVLSQFYTIFEKQANSDPTVTFYPLYKELTTTTPTTPTTTSSSSWKTIAIIAVVVLVALVVISFAFKKKNNLTKSDLGVELRAARV